MKKSLIIFLALILLFACKKDIFNKGDLTGVEADNVWDNESTANLYLNKTYDLVMPAWPTGIHNTSDESNNTGSTAILYGQLAGNEVSDIYAGSGSGVYYWIRRANIALEGLAAGSMPVDAKNKQRSQNYFLRAYMYFNLVKLYGGVPLVMHVQDVLKEDLNVPRSKTSACIDSIVKDLDSCIYLPVTWASAEKGRITRGAALALKGKVLLFWASAQFNPGNDPERWQRAYTANKAAYDTLTKDGYALNASFANIFLDESGNNKEPIIVRVYDQTQKTTGIENSTRPISESAGGGGSNQPTWNLVKAFPMKNGLPPYNADGITVNKASGYDSVYYWKSRDPRFDATVAYNGSIWPLSGKAGRIEWIYTGVPEDATKQSATGFYCRKITNPAVLAANTLIGSGTDWIDMRFAEVLLNVAECANATGKLSEAQTYVIALRKRAGIDAGTNNLYGITATTAADMTTLIMNERRIEFAFEGKRYDDLRRTRLFDKLTGTTRMGLKIVVKAPFTTSADTTSKKKENLEYYFKPGIRIRDTININSTDYTKYFTVTEFSLDTQFPINYPVSYYFYPIPLSALQSNSALAQTNAWGGTFDPLQ